MQYGPGRQPAKAGNADTGADGHEKEKNMWEICKDLQDEICTMRRDLHQIPEIGGDLPETKAYVMKKLTEMGIPFTENKSDSGLMAEIRGGKPGKTIALRADMDALPIPGGQ